MATRLTGLICLLLFSGCGPSIAPLNHAIDNGHWDVALTYARGNDKLVHYLATETVRLAAETDPMPKPLVLALSPLQKTEREALISLSKRESSSEVAQLAEIVLHRDTRFVRNPARVHLSSDHTEVRALAATAFANRLDRPALHRMTRDLSSTVRGAAVAALCRLPLRPDTAVLLAERLQKDPMPHVRAAAARCGPALGQTASGLLREAIDTDDNPGVQRAAMQGLLTIASQNDVIWLTRFSYGPITIARLHAAAELAHRHLESGKARLRDALAASDPKITAAAIPLLSYGHVTNADPLLQGYLDATADLSTPAASLLLARGVQKKKATAALHTNWQKGDEDALDALVGTGHAPAIEQVRHQLGTDKQILPLIYRFAAVRELHDDFVSLLAHPDQMVRRAAAMAILMQAQMADEEK
ncbi:MAG: hypothetical protein JXX14_22450 [Deltaproteobacteria bacterium]|nr:hypothetical protein [Deltaproteobacteria bacterium]